MRPGQNKRMRGRNRKGPNPLTRSYESNGPDVKVRGTAAHIAEKYVQLARDAHSSGDPVAAESYLQHAEHYYRLLMAAQQAQTPPFQQHGGFQPRPQDVAEADDGEDAEDEFDSGVMDRFTFRAPQNPAQQQGNGGQPYYQGERGEGDMPDDQPRIEPRAERQDSRNDGRQDAPRGEGQPREGRGEYRGNDRYDNRGPRRDRNNDRPRFGDRDRDRQPYGDPRPPRPVTPVAAEPEPQPAAGLPAFITGGRGPMLSESSAETPAPGVATSGPEGAELAPKPRRRRRARTGEGEAQELPERDNDEKDISPAAE